jgi:hypothetical protein
MPLRAPRPAARLTTGSSFSISRTVLALFDVDAETPLACVDGISTSWKVSLALREKKVVEALLAEATVPGAWQSQDIASLTRDLLEIDRIIDRHALCTAPASVQ